MHTEPNRFDRPASRSPSTSHERPETGGGDDCDLTLIAAAQRGERSALDALARRHDRWVRHVVYATIGNPAVIEDVAQHVWATVCQQIGTLADPSRWRAWLYRTARNAAVDLGEKLTRERRRRSALPSSDPVARSIDPARQLSRAEEHERVLQAIRGLPAIYREPFVLRHVEEWTYAQIAEVLGLPVDTVETRLVRARRLLREALSTASPK